MPETHQYKAPLSGAGTTSQAKDLDRKNNLSQTGNKVAFTLAEVLITLGIIGVVAALTLPTLIQNYKDKQIVTALKKNYSVLNNAFNMAVAQYGEAKHWGTFEVIEKNNDGEDVSKDYLNLEHIVASLNVQKDCGYEANGCFSEPYKMLNMRAIDRDFENMPRYRKIVLNDGTLIALQGYESPDLGARGEIWVDVNGQKGPNAIGRDMFLFSIEGEPARITPYRFDNVKDFPLRQSNCQVGPTGSSGYTCTGWVLYQENLDYLYCYEKLSWNGQTKCK